MRAKQLLRLQEEWTLQIKLPGIQMILLILEIRNCKSVDLRIQTRRPSLISLQPASTSMSTYLIRAWVTRQITTLDWRISRQKLKRNLETICSFWASMLCRMSQDLIQGANRISSITSISQVWVRELQVEEIMLECSGWGNIFTTKTDRSCVIKIWTRVVIWQQDSIDQCLPIQTSLMRMLEINLDQALKLQRNTN